jgi:FtsX-like permease family
VVRKAVLWWRPRRTPWQRLIPERHDFIAHFCGYFPSIFEATLAPKWKRFSRNNIRKPSAATEPRVFCVCGGKRLWEFSERRRASTWRCFVKQYGLDKAPADEIYVPMAQNPLLDAVLVVKTAVEPMSIARGVIELLYAVDPNQPAARVRSLEQVRAESVAAPRLTTSLLGLFALLALAIAATGIGGVMALAVGQRRHEIGVRMAIGARPGEILRMILGQGMALALVGVALGLFGALWLTRLLQQLLFEVAPTDPLTYVGVAVVLGLAALIACYVPARRAARVDPIIALRVE